MGEEWRSAAMLCADLGLAAMMCDWSGWNSCTDFRTKGKLRRDSLQNSETGADTLWNSGTGADSGVGSGIRIDTGW